MVSTEHEHTSNLCHKVVLVEGLWPLGTSASVLPNVPRASKLRNRAEGDCVLKMTWVDTALPHTMAGIARRVWLRERAMPV